MFQPASLKGESPVPIDERLRNRFIAIYIIIIILSFTPCVILEYYYVFYLWVELNQYWIFFLLFPFNVVVSIYLIQIYPFLKAVLYSALL